MSREPHASPTIRLALRLFIVALFVSLVTPRRAVAYIDPLSGSVVLQVLAAGLMAATLSMRRFRDWAKELLRSVFRRRE